MEPIYAYYDSSGKLDSDSQQGYSHEWDTNELTTLSLGLGWCGHRLCGGSIHGHVSSLGDSNPQAPDYYKHLTHQSADGNLASEQLCLSLIADSDSGFERGTNISHARGLNNNCGLGFDEYDSNVRFRDSQFDDIPLWKKYAGSNTVTAQNAPGRRLVIQTASLHVEPSTTAPTSVNFNLEHAHGLIDLRNISEISPNSSQLVFQGPHGSGHYCRLAGCTSPFRIFASIADVIEHIRSEDAVISRPHGVWCNCNKWFSSKQVGLRHVRTLNGGKQHPCPHCSMRFKRLDEVTAHVRARHLSPPRKRIARTTKKKMNNIIGSSQRNPSYDA